MKDVLRQVAQALVNPTRLAVWFGVTGVIGLAGPFGTYDAMTLGVRLPYWAASSGFALVVVNLLRVLVADRGPMLDPKVRALIVALGSGVLITVFVTGGMWTLDFDYAGKAQMSPLTIFLVAFTVVGIVEMLKRLRASEAADAITAPEPKAERPASPRLVRRLPPELGEEIIHVSAQDHLVEIATVLGATQIRMRLADAMAELENADGFRIHRSHWVARKAITGQGQSGRRPVLVLSNGTEVPVSKKYEPMLRDMGFLS